MSLIQEYVKAFLSAPILFLIVIGIAIYWQQMNSKKLAKEANQDNRQATMFSWIMAASIFLCVANGWMTVAILGASMEAIVNILLVLKNRSKIKVHLSLIELQIGNFADKERKGKEILELTKEKEEIAKDVSSLSMVTNIFIGVLIPTFILLLSELYINS
ncbi:hypothetical protein [Ekhidna sp.]